MYIHVHIQESETGTLVFPGCVFPDVAVAQNNVPKLHLAKRRLTLKPAYLLGLYTHLFARIVFRVCLAQFVFSAYFGFFFPGNHAFY